MAFGHIEGVPVGSTFEDRIALAAAGVHRARRAGIVGRADEGAESVVLSGGYEDTIDDGDVILYTGSGGRNAQTGRQAADQQLNRRNLALANAKHFGQPVRVVRGARAESDWAPAEGYRYDGLYRVDDYWQETGSSGYRIWRFRLIKLDEHA